MLCYAYAMLCKLGEALQEGYQAFKGLSKVYQFSRGFSRGEGAYKPYGRRLGGWILWCPNREI